jgi:hypothetical protein
METGDAATVAELGHGRSLGSAAVVGEAAAGSENASDDVLAGRRKKPRDRVQPTSILALTSAGDAAEEPDGVGVTRVLEDLARRPLLHELAGVEDADPIAHLGDDGEVVADEQHRGGELGPEARDKIEDLGLDGGVERGRRLVEDEQ